MKMNKSKNNSNDMKLIMENWRGYKAKISINENTEFTEITVEGFLTKFGKYHAGTRKFLKGVEDILGTLDSKVQDSKKKKGLLITLRAVKNYAVGTAVEYLGGLIGGGLGALAGTTLGGAGALPGAGLGFVMGKEMTKAAQELLKAWWEESINSSSGALQAMFMKMQVSDGSSNDPLIKAFDLNDGYNILLRGGTEGKATEFYGEMMAKFLGQISRLVNELKKEEQRLTKEMDNLRGDPISAAAQLTAFHNKKLSELYPTLKTSDEIAKNILSVGGKLEVKPATP